MSPSFSSSLLLATTLIGSIAPCFGLYTWAPATGGNLPAMGCSLSDNDTRTHCLDEVPNGYTWTWGAKIYMQSTLSILADGNWRESWYRDLYTYHSDLKTGTTSTPGICNTWTTNPTPCSDIVRSTGYNATWGKTGTSIYDCKLKTDAIQYYHTSLEQTVTEYLSKGFTNYRFYDTNNFAWFYLCPNTVSAKEKLRNRNAFQSRRQSGARDGTKTPYWDFLYPSKRDPASDATSLNSFNLSPNFPDIVQASMFWPCNTGIYLDGVLCDVQAASRPGLQHWTVEFIAALSD